MNLLISQSSNPYQNLAVEEFLLKNSSEDFLFIYVNGPCVVVGKHQITVKEINSQFIFENNILIARRLSGGGTVFHDEGNLNISVIQTIPSGANISYKTLSKPIIEFLQKEGAAIYLSERNDIMLTDKKVSGSAMHIFKNRALAHSTLLIDCNLYNLSYALKSNPERFTDKSIASVRSKVMNLSEEYNNFSVAYIIEQFAKFVSAEYETSTIFSFSESDVAQIKVFTSEKYSTQEWIYGYSPKYNYKNSFAYNGNSIKYNLEIEKGIIKNVEIESINQLTSTIELELNKLIGKSHNISEFPWNNETLIQTDFYRQLITSLF